VVDLADPLLYESGDPHAVFARLRAAPGLHWNEEGAFPGFWSVTRHADALQVLADTRSFTTAEGILLRPDRGPDPASGRMLVMTDPPRHTELRRALNRYFNPATVARLEARVDAAVRALLDRVLDSPCDFVTDVAAAIPAFLICEMMGVPEADRDHVTRLTGIAFSAADPDYQMLPSERASRSAAHGQILAYFLKLLRRRGREPGDDIVSVLASVEIGGRRLDEREVLLDCDNVIVGGTETTRHAAAGGLLALVEHPDQLALLRRSPELVPTAVEEILRWTSPATHVMRTVRQDAVIAGQPLRPAERVVLWGISVNRDEAAFERADRLVVDRHPNRHLALGHGEYFCLGAALARMQLRVLFANLLPAAGSIELAGPPRRLRSNMITGFKSLPVLLRRRATTVP